MVRSKKMLIAFILVIMALLAPMSALAGTRVTGGYTLTFPDDMVSCKPVFNFTLAGASSTATVSFQVGSVNMSTGETTNYPAVNMTYSGGVFVGSFTTALDQGVYTFGAVFTVTDTDSSGVTFTKKVATYKWEVTCDKTPPPPGGEGCTPGYWKQPQHLDSWVATGYAPTDIYSSVFGVGPNVTLLEALNFNGAGATATALAKHSTAALLNAAHPDVDYDFTVAQVIAAVQAAFASGDFEGVKDTFDFYNNQGCSID